MQAAEVRESWSLAFDDETLHMVQSYVAAIVRAICALTDAAEPLLSRVEVVPHPEFGTEHLRPWFGASLAGSAARSLRLLIEARVADRPFRREFRERQAGRPERWHSLRCDSFAGSVKRVVGAMIGHEAVSLDSVAALSPHGIEKLAREAK